MDVFWKLWYCTCMNDQSRLAHLKCCRPAGVELWYFLWEGKNRCLRPIRCRQEGGFCGSFLELTQLPRCFVALPKITYQLKHHKESIHKTSFPR